MESKRVQNQAGSILLTVILIAILAFVNLIGLKKFTRVDLTAGQAYTLSDSTKRILGGLQDPILIKIYFTPDLPPPFSMHERYLRDLISDYEAYADGMLRYEYIDPTDDEDIKSEARNYGIRDLQITKVESDELGHQLAFMGLAIFHREKMEVLPFIESIENLEYEMTSAVKRLTAPKKTVIGFLEGWGGGNGQTGLMPLKEKLGKNFSPRVVEFEEDYSIDEEVDVLVVAGPKEPMSDIELYGLDQFLMHGRNIAFFVPRVAPNMQNFQGTPIESNVEKLLDAYGVNVRADLIKDEQAAIISYRSPQMPFPLPIRYPYIPLLGDFNADSIITKGLRQLPAAFASSLAFDDAIVSERNLKADALASTSPKAWLQEGFFLLDPQMIKPPIDEADYGVFNVAASLEGSFKSYFADKGAPAAPPPPEGEIVVEPIAMYEESNSNTRIFVMGTDSALNIQGEDDPSYVFVANALDWLAADDDMIGIRSKSAAAAPLGEIHEGGKELLKNFNKFGVPLLVILIGFIRWQWLEARRRRIAREWSALAN